MLRPVCPASFPARRCGFDPVIDPQLSHLLHYLTGGNGNSPILDSFKALTRNAEKLFGVMAFLLSRERSVATSHFYPENSHAERRVKPPRAGHTTVKMRRNLARTSAWATGIRLPYAGSP